jgi:hypothetical protein
MIKLTPCDWALIVTMVVIAVYVAAADDPRWLRYLRRRRNRRKVLPQPEEHSPGFPTSRRDISTGWWT